MTRFLRTTAATLLAAGLTAAPAAAASAGPAHARCPLPRFGAGGEYHPVLNRAGFTARVSNPWFPLPPGATYVYQGVDSGRPAVDVLQPSHRTRVVDGVRTREVNDRVLIDGRLQERTTDYYAQDGCGNVWYFGEDTALIDRRGQVITREGSWHAGVHGAQPGVFMQAHPVLRRLFRQEWARQAAEDQYSVISRGAPVTVPFRSATHALRTRETTALEPGVVDRKVYVRGVGEVVECSVHGGHDRLVLVDVLR